MKYQLIKAQLDNTDDHLKHLDRLATLLLTLTSLYALALGLNSYFGLKQILEAGKDDLTKLREFLTKASSDVRDKLQDVDTKVSDAVASANLQFAEFRVKLREKYPEFANLHENLSDVLGEIRLMFPHCARLDNALCRPHSGQREKIRVAELRFAGLEVSARTSGVVRPAYSRCISRLRPFL